MFDDARRRAKRVICVCAVFVAVTGIPSADAGEMDLGDSGWRAIWDDTLDPFVDIAVDLVTEDAVIIQKILEFTQGPGPGGVFPTIPITFQQIEFPAVEQIIINDEIITNSTGVDWTDFHMELVDGGDVAFNPDLTNASGGGLGFSTNPFDNQMFGDDNTTFWVDGFGLGPNGTDAVVPDGGVWFPGLIGELYIDALVQQQAPFTVFSLKETPTPEPASLALLGIGAAIAMRRSRRR